jgi:DNA polymerase III sliding clamp (beta) subunit (PCNA family)
MPDNEFPVVQSFVGDPIICIGSDDLKQALNATCFAAAQDNARPMLQAVHIVANDGKLTFFATDGFRLSKYVVGDSDKNVSVLVPRQSAIDVSMMCAGNNVNIYVIEGKVKFDFGSYHLIAQTIEQKYPDVSALIPSKMKCNASLQSDDLAVEVRATMMFGDNATAVVKFLDSAVELQANGNSGDVSSRISTDYSGEDVSFAVNSKYLSDVLSFVGNDTDTVTVGVDSNIKPIKILSNKHGNFTHVIMPVNIPVANSYNK